MIKEPERGISRHGTRRYGLNKRLFVDANGMKVAADICAAIRQKCPVVINMTTGTVGTGGPAGGGPLGPTGG